MKKLIRALIKIPGTFFVVPAVLFILIVLYLFSFYDWLYESDSYDKKYTQIAIKEQKALLKRWFTTV